MFSVGIVETTPFIYANARWADESFFELFW